MKWFVWGIVGLALLAGPGCGSTRQLHDFPAIAASDDETRSWDLPPSLPPVDGSPVEVDSLLTEDSDWLLDSLSVPIGPLGPVEEYFTDLPDISDTLAAETQANLPSCADLFDYPVVVNRRVLTWVDAFQGKLRANFERGLVRSGRYLAMARRIFREEGVPQDLVFLGHVESAFRYNALSSARALGLWQFMRGTARLYGLRCDGYVDERLDPEKATRASARYLKKLYGDFGDWNLALAAYNAGEGKVARAIERCGTRDFWGLAQSHHLLNETRNFVPAILAATILAKSPGAYGLSEELDEPLAYDTATVDSPTDLRVIAKCAGAALAELQRLNPALLLLQTPPGTQSFEVRLPVGTGEIFASKFAQIPRGERLVQFRHTVRKGETLGAVARKYGTTVGAIQSANRMGRRTLIRVGQSLVVPSRHGAVPPEPVVQSGGDPPRHVVRRGETLSMIARRYGVTAREIQKANRISNPNRISKGQTLVIPVPQRPEPAADEPVLASVESPPTDSEQGPDKGGADREQTAAVLPAVQRFSRRMQELNTSDNIGRVTSTAHIVEEARRLIEAESSVAPEPALAKVDAPPVVDEPDQTPAKSVVHRVRKGETLSKIAERYGVSVSQLKRWNRLGRSNLIRVGQRLTISEPKRDLAMADSPPEPRVHVVRRGDSLWTIAKRYGLNARELADRNGIGRSGRIYPGQKIRLP